MLDLRLINLEEVIKEQKGKEKDKDAAGVLVHDGNDTILDQKYYGNGDQDLGSPSQTSARAVSNRNLSIESKYKHPTTISFSKDFPSFLLPYRLHTSWPLVSALCYQAIRPCSALASPQTSQDLRVWFSDLRKWRYEKTRDANTCFQPKPSEIIYKRGFECGLPNKIKVGDWSFTNPDGGAPKSVIDDGDFKDQWEWGYITRRLEKKRIPEFKVTKQDERSME